MPHAAPMIVLVNAPAITLSFHPEGIHAIQTIKGRMFILHIRMEGNQIKIKFGAHHIHREYLSLYQCPVQLGITKADDLPLGDGILQIPQHLDDAFAMKRTDVMGNFRMNCGKYFLFFSRRIQFTHFLHQSHHFLCAEASAP